VPQKLDGIPGVRKVTAEKADKGWQAYSLRIESNTDVRDDIQALATAERWKIRELHRQLPSLEDVFIELAASDAPSPVSGSFAVAKRLALPNNRRLSFNTHDDTHSWALNGNRNGVNSPPIKKARS